MNGVVYTVGASWLVFLSLAHGQVVFQDDFGSGDPGPEWTNAVVRTTPDESRRFLGDYGNEAAGLQLTGLVPGERYRVRMNVLAINTWDGNGNVFPGPDVWGVRVGGVVRYQTTFSNGAAAGETRQAFPGQYPSSNFPSRTGQSEECECAWTWSSTACGGTTCPGLMVVYPVNVEIDATGVSMTVEFFASGLQSIRDESWGLDDVVVECLWISEQPVSRRVGQGETVTFAVTPGGAGPYTYQWRRNDEPVEDGGRFSGARSGTLTISQADFVDAGEYSCEVSGDCGSLESALARLTVCECPSDFGCDAGVDGDDIIAFFAAWDADDLAADFNLDFSVDGDDVIAFFAAWDVGC